MTILDSPRPAATAPLVGVVSATAREIIDALVDVGISHSFALPDSVNVHLLDALDGDPRIASVRVSTEDVGAAALHGLWLGGGNGVLVTEGSGLGLSTLVLARMINDRVPVLILTSHSGLHGERHGYHQSSALAGMGTLRGLGIAHHVAAPGDDLPALVRSLGTTAQAMMSPVALVLPLRSITRGKGAAGRVERTGMSDLDVAQVVLAERGNGLIVGSPGFSSCHLAEGTSDDVTVLSQQELGYTTPMAWGLAMAQPHRPVIGVDGDGSVTSRLSVLADLAHTGPGNLTIVVIDNGGYGTFALAGALPQAAPTGWGVDIAAVARACGMRHVTEARTPEQLRTCLAIAIREPGPRLVVAHAPRSEVPAFPEPVRPSVLVTQALRHHLTHPRPTTLAGDPR